MPKFLNNINLAGNELQNAVIQVASDKPSQPKLGQIFFDSDTDQLCICTVGYDTGVTEVWEGVVTEVEDGANQFNTGLKIGRDSQNLIDFATTDDRIIFRVANIDRMSLRDTGLYIINPNTGGSTSGGRLHLGSDDGSVVDDGERLGLIRFVGAEDASGTLQHGGKIEMFATEGWDATHSGAKMTFKTGSGDGALSTVLTLGSDQVSTFGGQIVVGVDDAGHDVKFFGATAGKYMKWDESEDTLNIQGDLTVQGNVDLAQGDIIGGRSKNYATSIGWVPDAASGFVDQTGYFGGNFVDVDAGVENSTAWSIDPFGGRSLVWNTHGTTDDDADGGWNKAITIPANNNMGYLSYVYVRRNEGTAGQSTANTTSVYLGCLNSAASTLELDGSAATSGGGPYFDVTAYDDMAVGIWYLVVGIIQAYTDAATDSFVGGGVYRMDTGQKIGNSETFKMAEDATTQSHRAFLYYSEDTACNVSFWNPGFHARDGSEPKLNELLGRRIVGGLDTDIKVGRDAHNLIDFTADNAVTVRVNDKNSFALTEGKLTVTNTASSSTNAEGGTIELIQDDTAALNDDHRLGAIKFRAAEDGAGTIQTGAMIETFADASWTSSENGARMVFSTTDANSATDIALTLDSDQQAAFTGTITTTGGLIQNTSGDLVIQNTAGAQFDIKSNQGVRLYIDKNGDDTDHKFELLSNVDTYASGNVILDIDQSGNATFAGTIGSGAITSTGLITGTSLDINGVADITGVVTVGVDGTGHDVKFYGATAGMYMQWDASEDGLVINCPEDEVGLGVYTNSVVSTTPNFRVGRNSNEYFGIQQGDREQMVVHRQDETDDEPMFTSFELWDNGSGVGDSYWQWNWKDGAGANEVNKMKLTKAGKLWLTPDSSVFAMGAGSDITLTHDGSTGGTLASAGNFIVDSTAGSLEVGTSLANGQTLKLGPASATQMVFTPSATAGNEKISIINSSGTAQNAIKIDAESGGLTLAAGDDTLHINADGTDADALDIDSAGGIDIDSVGNIDLATSGAAGKISLITAHTAGLALHIDADADVASEVQIDAGILDINVSDNITMDAADDIALTTTSADGLITLHSAHTAGQAVLIDANADAASVLDIDAGILDIDVQGAATLTAATWTVDAPLTKFYNTATAKPVVEIRNFNSDTGGAGILKFVKDKGTTAGADGDLIGQIFFNADDDTQPEPVSTSFAKIRAAVNTAANDSESGRLDLYVATANGSGTGLDAGLTLTGSSTTADEVNVTIGKGLTSTVTTAGHLAVTGNLTVSGTTTTVNTATLTVEDPLIKLASGNASSDIVDIGFYGLYDNSSAQDVYTGLTRDADDDKWHLWKLNQVEPTTVVDMAGAGYAVDTLVANLEGNVTGIASSASAVAADDITAGDAAVSIATSTGNVTVDSNAGSVTIDGHTGVTLQSTDSGDITLDSVADIVIDAAGNDIKFKAGGSGEILRISNSSSDVVIKPTTDAKDIFFQQFDGTNVLRIDDDTNAYIYNDLKLSSDASVLGFGTNNDVTLTHVHDTGLLLNSTNQLQFGDSGTFISQSADGVLDLQSNNIIELTATRIELNGIVEVDGYIRNGEANPQELVLHAGESYDYATGQTGEFIYLNAEQGVQINSHPDNWLDTGGVGATAGWDGRNTATICDLQGKSNFPGEVTIGTTTAIAASQMVLTPTSGDTFSLVSTTHGATSLTTVDTAGAAAHLTVVADGNVDIDGLVVTLDAATTIELEGTTNVTGALSSDTSVTVGSTVVTDDSIVMTPSTNDTFTIASAANGATSLTTVDTAAAAAHITVVADGNVDIDGVVVTLDASTSIELEATNVNITGALDVTGALTAGDFSITRSKTFILNDDETANSSANNVSSNNNGAASTAFTITHGMGASRNYKVEVMQVSDYSTVFVDVTRPSDTTIVVTFASNVALGAYAAMVPSC
jgi:hypothetical protein